MLCTKVALIWMAACTLVPAKTQDTKDRFASSMDSNSKSVSVMNTTVSPRMGKSEEQLQYSLWFFRTEDPSAWNYSVLALSFVALLLGLLILGMSIMANRNKKMLHRYKTELEATRTTETDMKQATVILKDNDPLKRDPLLDKGQNPGNITIEWKDGSVTPLYKNTSEESV